jgi:hypothetical protein
MKIAWEPWYDTDEEEEETNEENEKEVSFDDNDDGEEINIITSGFLENQTITTPIGVYPVGDRMLPTKFFKECWIGHTDFPICQAEKDILENIPGIECLKIITKYRFFVGVGKMFDFSTIRKQIQNIFCETNYDDQDVNFKWAMFVNDDKSVEIMQETDFNTIEEFNDAVAMLKKIKNNNVLVSE